MHILCFLCAYVFYVRMYFMGVSCLLDTLCFVLMSCALDVCACHCVFRQGLKVSVETEPLHDKSHFQRQLSAINDNDADDDESEPNADTAYVVQPFEAVYESS